MTDLDKLAREILAAEYKRVGGRDMAVKTLAGQCDEGASMRAARAALLTAPPGYVLVPVEPTEDMQYAATDEQVGGHCYVCSKWDCSRDDARRVWDAMLAAAPEVK